MKVDGPGRVHTPQKNRKSGKAKGDGPAFQPDLGESEQAGESAAARQTHSVMATGSLLAVQEMPDASQGRSKGLTRARTLLDQLEDVRRGLLLGAIPRDRLSALAQMARQRREEFLDPQMNALLDEIELRAEVELAKLEQD